MRVEAESLFRTKPISEIRNVEATTNKQIQDKQAELRQLVGTRYRDLIDSADSIVQMKSACEAIASSISSIHLHIRSLSAETPKHLGAPNANRQRIYGIACRVKYLVDTPENIWGCLDESLFLEAAARYVRAKHVHSNLISDPNHSNSIFSNFPLLQHQWQIVESFKPQISQRSRERLLDSGLPVGAYADALAAVAVVDELEPAQVLGLFLDSRKTWLSQRLSAPSSSLSSNVVSVFCDVLSVIQISAGQVGELFLRALNDMPLFYKVILDSPPASQLFGGIPNPDQEVMMWKSFRDSLESTMVMLDKAYIAKTCLSWLRDCGKQIVDKVNGKYLIDAITSGQELGSAEKLIRDTMNSKEILEGSLEWLRSVFGSEIELPWSRIQELVLGDDSDLWDEIFEYAFVRRMKLIIDSRFTDLTAEIHVSNSIHAVGVTAGEATDFQAYLSRPSTGGGVWFIEVNTVKKSASLPGQKALPEENDLQSCLNAYFGAEVSRIRDVVDSRCQSVLEDLLGFLESPKASLRLKDLAPYLQCKCFESISTILREIDSELGTLYASMESRNKDSDSLPAPTIVERSLFIGRLLFALQNHSRHIPVLLGSPRFWAKDTLAAVFDKLPSLLRQSSINLSLSDNPGRQMFTSPRRQTSAATAALLGANETANPKLDELNRTTRDLSIRAHTLWISWLSTELSNILSRDLEKDDILSATASSKGWEELVVRQDQADDGSSEMKISLPSMPSTYVISFLFRACEEIHRVGVHVLDKSVVQKFASSLLEKVIGIYENFISVRDVNGSQVSEKGVLQILLDIRFVADVLRGGDSSGSELSRVQTPKTKSTFRMKQGQMQSKSITQERIDALVASLSQKLDPIDWLTYEPYLWENEKQSYLKHAVLFGFFVQLCRLYTDTVQKLPSNSESNIMRCSTVPRYKYLPISAPALASKGKSRTSVPAALDDIMSKGTWKAYANGELSQNMDLSNNSSFGVAAPLLKSFMQVGSKFGESTLKLGSILTDGQVGIFKDRSTTSMSTFGDILPLQAAGLLSSFTTTRSDS